MYRNIVELTCMSNNLEVVFYTEDKMDPDDPNLDKLRRNVIDQPRLVLSRKVYEEVERLNFGYKGYKHEETPSDATLILDAYFSLKEAFSFKTSILKKEFSISVLIASYIGTCFYDCMSGGCPVWELAILRYLCLRSEIDKTEKVYPKTPIEGDNWVTIQDFLDETESLKIPDVEEILSRLRVKLPTIFLLE